MHYVSNEQANILDDSATSPKSDDSKVQSDPLYDLKYRLADVLEHQRLFDSHNFDVYCHGFRGMLHRKYAMMAFSKVLGFKNKISSEKGKNNSNNDICILELRLPTGCPLRCYRLDEYLKSVAIIVQLIGIKYPITPEDILIKDEEKVF